MKLTQGYSAYIQKVVGWFSEKLETKGRMSILVHTVVIVAERRLRAGVYEVFVGGSCTMPQDPMDASLC